MSFNRRFRRGTDRRAAQERRRANAERLDRECRARREGTYWNGYPTPARIVRVIVGESPRDTWWCADLVGTIREAVEVTYNGQVFYLDNEDGSGWRKVTIGRGSPEYGHSGLPVAQVLGPAEEAR